MKAPLFSTLLIMALGFLNAIPGMTQSTGKITGKIVAEKDGNALSSCNIVIPNTSYGTSTEADGSFTFEAPVGEQVVEVSFLGFETTSQSVLVKAGEETQLNLSLVERSMSLAEVMVTETQKRADQTATISVVTQEEIEASRHAGAYDVLGGVPGVHIMQGHAIGYGLANPVAGRMLIRGLGRTGGGDLRIRGIQILIDGMPDYSQSHGHPFPDVHALDNVERIEIIKGPASVQYGNAMSGAIVLKTKIPDPGFSYYLKGSTGSFTTSQTLGRLGYRGEKGYIQAGGTYRHTGGFRKEPDALTAYNGSLKFGYALSPKLDIDFNGLIGHHEWENPGPGGLPGGKNNWRVGDVNLRYKTKNATASVKVWGMHGKVVFGNGVEEPVDQFGAKTKTSLHYGKGSTKSGIVTIGMDWLNYEIARDENSSGKNNEVGPYVMIKHNISKKILAESGLRFTYNEQFGTDLSPEFGLLFKPVKKTSIHARVAHGFRTPNAFETSFGGKANPNLDAADLWQTELGINQSIGERFTLEVTGFLQDGSNMIRVEADPTRPSGQIFSNSGEFSHKGIEVGATLGVSDYLALNLTTTNLDLGDNTALVPHGVHTFGLAFTPGPFSFRLDGRYITGLYNKDKKQEKLDNYFVTDLSGSYKIHKQVDVFVAVENLFDENYQIVKGFDMPGIGIFAGLRINGRTKGK